MLAFMVALAHSKVDDFIMQLEKYCLDPTYIIGMETACDTHQDTSGEHLHVMVDMTDKIYDNSSKTFQLKWSSTRR